MEFRRALRILTSRWWLVALGGFAGIVVAVYSAQVVNARIVPDFEARAIVNYLTLETETEGDFVARLGNARSVAVEVLDQSGQNVQVDADVGTLTFTAVGSDQDVLVATVSRLRDEFFAIETDQEGFEAATTAELERLQIEIDEVRDRLRATMPAAPSIDAATAAERDQLGFEINSLRQRIASLRIQLAFPDLATADAETLQADLDRSQDLLVRLTQGLAELPSLEVTETTQGLDTLVLQRHLQDLEARYVSFSLGLLEQPDVIGPISPAFVADNSRDDIGTRLAGAGGLLAGVIGMIVVLFIADRLRPTLWTAAELEPAPAVVVLDGGRPGANGKPWYPTASASPRRRQLQTLRAALDPVFGAGPVSVGVVGLSVPQVEIQALAADLAASVAASGTRVLLVDAAFDSPSALPEYGIDVPTLSNLMSGGNGLEIDAQIKRALSDRSEILPEMRSLRAGRGLDDAADALAGPRLRTLLNTAVELDDLVIMAMPPLGDPGSDVLSQRLDHLIVVCRSQKTTRREYRDAMDDLADRSAEVSGVALLSGRQPRALRANGRILAGLRGYGRHRRANDDRHTSSDEESVTIVEPETEPAKGASSEERAESQSVVLDPEIDLTTAPGDDGVGIAKARPRPTRGEVPVFEQTSGQEPHSRSGTGFERGVIGRHVRSLSPLDEESPLSGVITESEIEVIIDDRDSVSVDAETAERNLANVVVDLLGRAPGADGVPDGMLVMTIEDGEVNAAEILEERILTIRESRVPYLNDGFDEVLDGRVSAWRLHRWLEESFFAVHRRDSGAVPDVWHVSSRRGSFQALVVGETFDADHIPVLRGRIRTTIDRLARALADAGGSGDPARIEVVDAAFNEVRSFNQELFELRRRWQAGEHADRAARYQDLLDCGYIGSVGDQLPSDQD